MEVRDIVNAAIAGNLQPLANYVNNLPHVAPPLTVWAKHKEALVAGYGVQLGGGWLAQWEEEAVQGEHPASGLWLVSPCQRLHLLPDYNDQGNLVNCWGLCFDGEDGDTIGPLPGTCLAAEWAK